MTKSLADFFQTSIFMTGTPSEFQKVITKESFHCDCPIYEAVRKGYVARPTLNLINCYEHQYNSAVLAVYKNELKISKTSKVKWPIHIIANCSSIDEVDSLYTNCWKNFAKKEKIHLISVHSKKCAENKKTLDETDIVPRFDDETDLNKIITKYRKEIDKWISKDENNKEPKEMMNIVELIDAGVILNGEPVVLFQVDMISEGANLCSFNAGIIKSKGEVKSTQQIGRIIRDYTITDKNGEHHKIREGHANIYSIIENENDICNLLERLEKFELTSDSFDWGRKVDISNGGSAEPDPDAVPTISDFVWDKITDVEIKEYRALFVSNQNDKDARHIPTAELINLSADDMKLVFEALNQNSAKDSAEIKNKIENLKNIHKEIENENKKNNNKNKKKINEKKAKAKKNMISVQFLINNLRRIVIHNQLKENQPHGWVEWTKYNKDFIFRYLANGNEKYATAITNVLNALKDYLHLNVNPNK